MKITTSALKKASTVVGKCKPNQLLPISNYYELHFHVDGLTITATDGNCSISVSVNEGATEEEQKLIVKADMFSKLISKTTTEYMNLNAKDGYLEVKGNGTYKIEIFDEEDYLSYEMEPYETFKVNVNEFKQGLISGKATKSVTASDGVLYNYLVRNGYIVATDALKMSVVAVKGFNTELLIPPALANLIEAFSCDTCTVSINETKTEMLITGDNVVVYGSLVEGADEFPDVTSLFEDEYEYELELNIGATVQALDRLKLFASNYDSSFIDAVFGSDTVILSNDNSQEEVKYTKGVKDAIGLACSLNTKHLQDILKSMKGESTVLHLSSDLDVLYFECNKDKFILSTVEGDE